MELRDYQEKIEAQVYQQWEIVDNVLVVAPCGSGKSAMLTKLMSDAKAPSIAIAHRAELVFQLSITLARWGVRHNVIAQKQLIKSIIRTQISLFGKSFYSPSVRVHVASVQTLIGMDVKKLKIGLWIVDEVHHLTDKSTWAKCIEQMHGAKGAGFTATPCRSDGKGLGRDAHGLMDVIVEGPGTRELIARGYLSDYKIYAPSTNIDLSNVPVGASGDYVQEKLRESVHKSRIVGDTVANYRRFANGKRALVFTVDIASADEIHAAFKSAGILSASVNGKTDPEVRARTLRKLETGEIKVVVNCELFGEGTDLPAVECAIFARPTQSLGLFIQQFQRPMRKDDNNPGKIAIIIDQVGNVARHGLPDTHRVWTLDARERTSREAIKQTVRTCQVCTGVYEIVKYGLKCPYCGAVKQATTRSGPEMVDGDLSELPPEILAALRGKINEAYSSPKTPHGATPVVVNSIKKAHRERVALLEEVREAIATWAIGRDDIPLAQRQFFFEFGIDVMSAQALSRLDASLLLKKIRGWNNVNV